MKFNIDSKIFENYPDLKIGLILIKDLDNTRRSSALDSLLRGITAQKEREFRDKELKKEYMLRLWDEAYVNFGVNPNKYNPSIRALLTRIQKGQEIQSINPIVNTINYHSLKYLVPMGSEDLDWLCGDLKLTYTKGGEPFRSIATVEIEEAKENEVAYMDDGGITCRYWNYRECERTKITDKTRNVAIFLEDLSKKNTDELWKNLREIEQFVRKYIGGDVSIHIMDEENSWIDFGIEGRKNIDDSKITAQEKAYILAMQKKEEEVSEKKIFEVKKVGETPLKVKEKKDDTLSLSNPDSLKEKIRKVVEQGIIKAYPQPPKSQVSIEYPAQSEHGDYACNIAMQLAKELKDNPLKIAETLISQMPDADFIEKVEVVKPGFMNFFISEEVLNNEVEKVLRERDLYGSCKVGEGKTIVLDYSSPNIAKPLGVHHIPTTIIGQSLYDIFKKIGFNSVSVNHIGDWGTQYGKLTWAFKKWGDRKLIEENPIHELLKLYVRFHDEAEENPDMEDQAREEFKKLEDGNKENRKLWKWFVELSMKDIQKSYDKLTNIHFDYNTGESFYENMLEEMLKEGKERGIFEKGEEGAYMVNYDDPNIPPFLVQKKDGATLYSTRDFAALKYRIDEWHPVKILYIVDIAQTLHFKQLFEGAQRFNWYHGEGVHVWFGRMKMKDKKMSTRKGNVILMDELIDESIERSKKIVKEKNKDLENVDEVAGKIGVASIKYSVLSQNKTTNITFDWDKILSFEGNSAPYLQYTYARAKSILRKAEGSEEETVEDNPEVKERIQALLRILPKFSEEILTAAQEYKPNIVCNYLYKLAQEFNAFYNGVSVLKSEEKETRLQIVDAVSQILKNGLKLLGIDVVEEM